MTFTEGCLWRPINEANYLSDTARGVIRFSPTQPPTTNGLVGAAGMSLSMPLIVAILLLSGGKYD